MGRVTSNQWNNARRKTQQAEFNKQQEMAAQNASAFFQSAAVSTQGMNDLLNQHVNIDTLKTLTSKRVEINGILDKAKSVRDYYQSVGNKEMVDSVDNVASYLNRVSTAIDNRRGLNGMENMFADMTQKLGMHISSPANQYLKSKEDKAQSVEENYSYNQYLKYKDYDFKSLTEEQAKNSANTTDDNRESMVKLNDWIEDYKQSKGTDQDYESISTYADERINELKNNRKDKYKNNKQENIATTDIPRNASAYSEKLKTDSDGYDDEKTSREIEYWEDIKDKYSTYAKYGKSNIDSWNNELSEMSLEEMEKYSSDNTNTTNALKNKIAEMDGGSEYLKWTESTNSQPTAEGFIDYRSRENLEDFSDKEERNLYRIQDESKAAVSKGEYIQEYMDNYRNETTDYNDLEYIKNKYDSEIDNADTNAESRDPLDVKAEWQDLYQERYNRSKQEHNFTNLSQEEQNEILNQTAYSLNLNQTFSTGDKDYIEDLDISEYDGNFLRNKKADLIERGYSPEEADGILSYAESVVNQEIADKQETKAIEYGEEHPIRATILSVPASLKSGVGAATNIWTKLKENKGSEVPVDWNSASNREARESQALRTGVKNKINNELGQFIYDAFTSTVDSAATLPINAFAPGATMIILGSSAAEQSMLNAHDKGMGDTDAIKQGVVAGIFEGLFETVSLDKLTKGVRSVKNIGDFFTNTAKSMGIEASEEVFTEAANITYDILANGGYSDYQQNIKNYINQGYSKKEATKKAQTDLTMQVLEAGAGGALGGAMFSSVGIVNYAQNRKVDKAVTDIGTQGQNVINQGAAGEIQGFIAQNYGEDSEIYNQMRNTDFEDAKQVGFLVNNLVLEENRQMEESEANSEAAALMKRLEQLGVSKNDSAAVAVGIVKGQATEDIQSKMTSEYSKQVNQATQEYKTYKKDRKGKKAQAEWTKEINKADQQRHYSNIERFMELTTSKKVEKNVVKEKVQEKVEQKVQEGRVTEGSAYSLDNPDNSFDISTLVVGTDGRTKAVAEGTSEIFDMENVVANKNTIALYEYGQEYEPEARETFFRTYNESGDLIKADDFALAYAQAYNYGSDGLGVSSALQNQRINSILTSKQINDAYESGKLEFARKSEEKAKAVRKSNKTGKITFEGVEESKLDKTQKAAVDVTKIISRATGVNFIFFESQANEDGLYTEENGSYDWVNNTIRIDINAGRLSEHQGNNIMIVTLAHELTHYIERLSPSHYGQIQEFIFDRLQKRDGMDSEERIASEINSLKAEDGRSGNKLKTDEKYRKIAMSEITARGCETMLTDKVAISELAKANRGLFGKIKAQIEKLLKSIENACKELLDIKGNYRQGAISDEARLLLEDSQKLRVMWNQALKEAGENEKTVKVRNEGKLLSVRKFQDGRMFVDIDTDQHIFEGKDRSEYPRIAKDYMMDKFKGTVVGITNRAFVNGDKIGEYRNPRKSIKEDYIYDAKLKAGTELDNLIEVSEFIENKPDGEDGHFHKNNIGGFDYYKTLFRVDGRFFEGVVNIEIITQGRLFKDITKIKDVTDDTMSSYGENPKSQFVRTSSNDSISNNSKNSNNNLKQSRNIVDSNGNTLTEQQQEYFKDSKVRDTNGALKVMYHGSNSEFTVFDIKEGGKSNSNAGIGFWFTETKEGANNFANSVWYGEKDTPSVYESYLNIKNPKIYRNGGNNSKQRKELSEQYRQLQAEIDKLDEKWYYPGLRLFINRLKESDEKLESDLSNFFTKDDERAEFISDLKKYKGLSDKLKETDEKMAELRYSDAYELFRTDIYKSIGLGAEDANIGGNGRYIENKDEVINNFRENLIKEGYDGIIIENTEYDAGTMGENNTQYVAFYSNQIKNITNKTPTEDVDIRYQSRYTTPKTYDEALRQNAKYKEAIENLKQQFKITKGHKVGRKGIDRLTNKLIRETRTILTKEELRDSIEDVFNAAATRNLSADETMELLKPIIRQALREKKEDTTRTPYATEILKELSKTRVRLTKEQKAEIESTTGMKYNEWRKSMFGKILIAEDGISLDSKWVELSAVHPELFKEDVTPLDQPQELADIIYNLQNDYANEWNFDHEDAIDYIAAEMLAEYSRLPEVKTYADRQQDKLKKQQALYEEKIGEVRADYHKKVKEYEKKQKEKYLKARERWKKKQQEREEELKAEYKIKLENRIASLKLREDSMWRTRDKEQLRKAIIRTVKRINRQVINPTNQKHITEGFRGKVAEFCQEFLNDTSVFNQTALDELKLAYAAIDSDETFNLHGVYDEDVNDMIDILRNTIAGKRLSQLTWLELEQVNDIVNHFDTIIKNEQEMEINGRKVKIAEVGKEALNELSKKKDIKESELTKGAKQFLENNKTPIYFFKHLGSTISKLFTDIRMGQDKIGKYIYNAKDFVQTAKETYHYDKWDFDKRLELSDGTSSITLNVEQAMYIYATKNRELKNVTQQADHLGTGGVIMEDNLVYETLKDGRKRLVRGKTQQRAYHIRNFDLAKISEFLTEEQKNYANVMVHYLSVDMAALGNETSMELYGLKKFNEKYYFPYKVASNYIEHSATAHKDVDPSLLTQSFTKALKDKANNPIIVGEFTATAVEHIEKMITYNGLAVAQDNLNRVFNYVDLQYNPDTGEREGSGDSYRQMLTSKKGEKATRYFDNFIIGLNGGIKADSTAKYVEKMLKKFKKNAVAASLSVAIQQPSAICRAMVLVDPKYFIPGGIGNKTWEELKTYSGVAVIKEMGGYDTGLGAATRAYIENKTPETAFKKVAKKVDDAFMYLPGKLDQATWCAIWNAVKREIKAKGNYKGNEAEFFKAASERFDEVINYTQVYDSVIAKSANMTSKDGGMKMLTAFMAEPTLTWNIAYDATVGSRGFKYTSRALSVIVLQTVVNGTLKALIQAARNSKDEDEDKTYLEKYVKAFSGNVFSLYGDWNPLTWIPISKDVLSIWEGFTVERSDMSVYSDLIEAIKDTWDVAVNDKEAEVGETLENLAAAIGPITGVPVKNILKDIHGVQNVITDAVGNNLISLNKKGLLEAFKEGMGVKEKTTAEKVEDILNGNTQLMEEMISEKEADIREKYPAYSDDKIRNQAKSEVRTNFTKAFKAKYVVADDQEKKDIIEQMKSTGLYTEKHKKKTVDVSKKAAIKWEVDYLKELYLAEPDITQRREIRKKLYATGYYDNLRELQKAIKSWTE